MDEYGKVYMNLKELIKKKEISKTQLSYRSKISHTQINRDCVKINSNGFTFTKAVDLGMADSMVFTIRRG